jgi:hypothetical protein
MSTKPSFNLQRTKSMTQSFRDTQSFKDAEPLKNELKDIKVKDVEPLKKFLVDMKKNDDVMSVRSGKSNRSNRNI